jgi:predicted glycoside hydrolase/deacetylase ChbG (UPF0249 family)
MFHDLRLIPPDGYRGGMPSTTVTICADDYGLAPGIGVAIRALIEAGRLQATGCMTGTRAWPEEAAKLAPLAGRAEFGVHLTLTDHRPIGPMPSLAPDGRFPSLGQVLRLSLTGRLDAAEIAAELERQVDSFERAMGRAPDFLDGHHHVHQLPGVRDAVIGLARRRLATGGWVRSCWDSPLAIMRRNVCPGRALVIAALGLGFDSALDRAGIRRNHSFRGVYDFSDRWAIDRLFVRFTDRPKPGTLVMCHPGMVDDELRALEHLTTRREVEFRFLASEVFAGSLRVRGLSLGPLPRE